MSLDADAARRDLPASVGRYQILERLDSDASGEVYHGFDPLLERPVILRVFNLPQLDAAAVDAIKLAFYEQMRGVGMLSHHGIAALFDGGEVEQCLFFANEYVDGHSLPELLSETPEKLDLPRRASLIIQLGDALDHAHLSGVSHLTLDPSHVRVDALMMLKVGGFGVAAVLDAIAAAVGKPAPMSDHFVAPERRRGEACDQQADLFSFAYLALEVLLDRRAGTATENGTFPIPAYLIEEGIDAAEWREVFERGLAHAPADRYATAAAFVADLLRVLGGGDESKLRWALAPPIDEAPPLDLPPPDAMPAFDEFPETIMSGSGNAHPPLTPVSPASKSDSTTPTGEGPDETMLGVSSEAPTISSSDLRAAIRDAEKKPKA